MIGFFCAYPVLKNRCVKALDLTRGETDVRKNEDLIFVYDDDVGKSVVAEQGG